VQAKVFDAELHLHHRVASAAGLGVEREEARIRVIRYCRKALRDDLPRLSEQRERVVVALALRVLQIAHGAKALLHVHVLACDPARLAYAPSGCVGEPDDRHHEDLVLGSRVLNRGELEEAGQLVGLRAPLPRDRLADQLLAH
jgi:hypothetical protein